MWTHRSVRCESGRRQSIRLLHRKGQQDVYDKLLSEEGGLSQQKALTQEIATIRERLVNSGALIRWSRQHPTRFSRKLNGVYNGTPRWFAKHQRLRQSAHEGRTQRALQMMNCTTTENQLDRVVEQNTDVPMPQILEEIVEVEAVVDIVVSQSEFIFGFSVNNVF